MEGLKNIWYLWSELISNLPEWMFASDQEKESMLRGLSEQYNIDEKEFYNDISNTIRKVFYWLVGSSVFCIITIIGLPDSQLLAPTTTIDLPVINYKIGFHEFLIVGPVILITLTIYLHIFVGQHKLLKGCGMYMHPSLPSFNNWPSRLIVAISFYWVAPITLAVFTWKAWPGHFGYMLLTMSMIVSFCLVYLQIRRCSSVMRPWVLPGLLAVFLGFWHFVTSEVHSRQLNLIKVDFSSKDLRSSRLVGAMLQESILSNANLSATDLSGANFTKATLEHTDLSNADLGKSIMDYASMDHANLAYSNIGQSSLKNIDISNSDLSHARLVNSNLTNATIYSSELVEANLEFAILNHAKLNKSNLKKANITNASLDNAKLVGADLTEAVLTGSSLKNADLSKARMVRAKLVSATITNAVLNGADLENAQLYNAVLSGSKLRNANLKDANLFGVNLTGADLTGANLQSVRLTDAMLANVNFSGADLSGVVVMQKKINSACGDEYTKLPKDLKLRPCASGSGVLD